ncbi:hypothetical protein CEP51_000359 [Fusarium floridanum]|uniref:FAD dependent oxidoreductase domain-containing protein n=1 Tax=Fusarium floridanum TaxID=1325733 RepID=A0A428SMW3_9HYPO|nr:hypothetical protein CEP51_000359 [Fusarium floridanum]
MSFHSPGSKFPDSGHTQSWSYFVRPWYDQKSHTVERGHYYAHQHPDTKQLWVGGHLDSVAGYITSDDTEVDNAAATNIVRALPRFFNEEWIDPAECRMETVWSGIMANTADSLPFVGRLPHSATGRMGTGEWISAGYNSYGMTNGLLCGTAVAEMALGNDVSAWFPEVYLVNEERLRGPIFQKENMTEEYLKRCMSIAGIKDINAKL